MTAWERAIGFVLKMEGGYGIDPNDPGGETNFGISKKSYPTIDIKNMTQQMAEDIYFRDYWTVCKCDAMPFGFAIAVLDCAVNQGVGESIRLLQKTLGVEVDGVIGAATLLAITSARPSAVDRLLAERLAAYARLMAAKPNLLVYAMNWSYRVIQLSREIINDAI